MLSYGIQNIAVFCVEIKFDFATGFNRILTQTVTRPLIRQK
jgi:hypothetical protein